MSRHFYLQFFPIFCLLLISTILFGQNSQSSEEKLDTSSYYPGDIDFNLIIATDKGYLSEVKRLIEKGAKVNTATYNGITPLMYAVQNQDKDIAAYLIEKGANLDKIPNNGIAIILAACRTGNIEMIELLVRKGADINIKSNNGITPLIYAASIDDYILCDMLLYYGAWINYTDYRGNSPLIVAAYRGYRDIVELFIEKGADINQADNKGYTPLICAIQQNNDSIAHYLIERGANINASTNFGHTALSYAILMQDTPLVNLLLDRGALPNLSINRTNYPLNLAKEMELDSISSVLASYGAIKNTQPVFEKIALGFHSNFTSKDAFLGGSLSLYDYRYNIGIHAGFYGRVNPTAVLIKESERSFTQYREKRSYILLGASKTFAFVKKRHASIGLLTQADLASTFGKYRGSTEKPPTRMLFSPKGGLQLQGEVLEFSIAYRYIDFNAYNISPHRIELGLKLLIAVRANVYEQKKILW